MCKEFAKAVSRGIVAHWGDSYSIAKTYFVDDGDGVYDDMTDDMEITFCPFCGKRLNGKHL